jgi:hypothetical protein
MYAMDSRPSQGIWFWRSAALALACLLWPPSCSAASNQGKDHLTNTVTTSTTGGKIALRLLYAGSPGSAREREFVAFLGQHFREVKTGNWSQFDGSQAAGFDVVILDYEGDGFKAPQPPVADGYARPTITVGVAGAFLCGRLNLKPGYM